MQKVENNYILIWRGKVKHNITTELLRSSLTCLWRGNMFTNLASWQMSAMLVSIQANKWDLNLIYNSRFQALQIQDSQKVTSTIYVVDDTLKEHMHQQGRSSFQTLKLQELLSRDYCTSSNGNDIHLNTECKSSNYKEAKTSLTEIKDAIHSTLGNSQVLSLPLTQTKFINKSSPKTSSWHKLNNNYSSVA